MNMEEFIEFCKKGNPISGVDQELHELLTQCSYDAQKNNDEIEHILSFKRGDSRYF